MTNKIEFEDMGPLAEQEPLLRWFSSAHLPPPLKSMMQNFAYIAGYIVGSQPPSAERTIALRKLIESKDSAIRGLVDVQRKQEEEAVPTGGDSVPGTGGGNG